MGNNIFQAPDSTAQQMADCLPDGEVWAVKNEDDSNCRKLINCLAVAHNAVQQQIELLDDEFRVNGSFDLLEDWETSVGIPDECLGVSVSIDDRRLAVIERIRKQPIVTLAQMQAYVDNLFPGLGITLYPGIDYAEEFEYEWEIPFYGDAYWRFILVATVPIPPVDGFEYEFEFLFEGTPDTSELECLLNQINPANVYILIVYEG